MAEAMNGGGNTINLSYVSVYVPQMYQVPTADDISSHISQCIDPRAGTNNLYLQQSMMTCTLGLDGPKAGYPVPILSAAASTTTPRLIDTIALFSAVSSAEASATRGGRKNDGMSVGGGSIRRYLLHS